MHRRILTIAALIASLGAGDLRAQVPDAIQAVTPGIVNYQGRMVTAEGANYADGVYVIQFRLWTESTGGTARWGAQYHTYVSDGYFNVMLGAPGGSALDGVTYGPTELWKALWFDPSDPHVELFMGVKVLNTPAGEPIPEGEASEAFPRQQLASVPYATRAQAAEYARRSVGRFDVGGDLVTEGDAAVGGEFSATGPALLSGGVTASGGAAIFQQGITVNGAAATLNQGLDVKNATAYLRAGAEVTGLAQLKGGATVTGNAVFDHAHVEGDLDVDRDVAADKLTLAGFESTDDPVIDFGQSFGINADTKSGTPGVLRLQAPASGEMVIGPRADTERLRKLDVRSDDTRFHGADFQLQDLDRVQVNGHWPIVIRRFGIGTHSMTRDRVIDTLFPTDVWSAAIVGVSAGRCDVEEDGEQWSWRFYMEPCEATGKWYIRLRGHTQVPHPEWDVVDVMFIRREIVDDDRPPTSFAKFEF